MDTRFWGPSGWRLLHLISFQKSKQSTKDTNNLHNFFTLVSYILPCKYCRASFTDYLAADPIPTDANNFPHWLFRIHNRVNGKLREQKLLETPDPKWLEIKKRYENWILAPCSIQRLVGWDFLYSIAYTTPSHSVASKPMPGAPPKQHLKTAALQNRWNVLSREERIPYIQKWWSLLPSVLPFEEWRTAWSNAQLKFGNAPVKQGRHKMTAWLYKMEQFICAALQESNPHNSFEGLCSELSAFSSGCGTAKRSKTCRATKQTARKRLTRRRTFTYKATGGFL
jgi:hypothetical protein